MQKQENYCILNIESEKKRKEKKERMLKMAIFVTGDTHGDMGEFMKRVNPINKAENFVIICGDFGFIWDGRTRQNIATLETLNLAILFVDGNHENFVRLSQYPKVPFCGGATRQIGRNIFHLRRGETYTIEGNNIFCFGGAKSTDRVYRTEFKSWWSEEEPSSKELLNAYIPKHRPNGVDYIITHEVPVSISAQLYPNRNETYPLNQALENVMCNSLYKHWYAGHHHVDRVFEKENLTILYKNMVKLGSKTIGDIVEW